jgi:hypothetical protein
MSVKSTVAAAGATLAVVCGAAMAATPPANAATPRCGQSCVELYGGIPATRNQPSFVIDAFDQGESAGTPVILSGVSSTDPGEDFTIALQATVNEFFQADLVSALLNQNYGGDTAFELQYTPGGSLTGQCVGVAAPATTGEKVSLQPCGSSGQTVWIVDSSASITGSFVPLINGSDTNLSEPFVLTYPSGSSPSSPTGQPAPQLEVANLQENSGRVPDNQLWRALGGMLDADLSSAQPG